MFRESGERFRLNVVPGAARAAHAHHTPVEAIVELSDVSEHAHERIVLVPLETVYAVRRRADPCIPSRFSHSSRAGPERFDQLARR